MTYVYVRDVNVHGVHHIAVMYKTDWVPMGKDWESSLRIILLKNEDAILLGRKLYYGFTIPLPQEAEIKVGAINYEVKKIGRRLYIIRPAADKCLVDIY